MFRQVVAEKCAKTMTLVSEISVALYGMQVYSLWHDTALPVHAWPLACVPLWHISQVAKRVPSKSRLSHMMHDACMRIAFTVSQ